MSLLNFMLVLLFSSFCWIPAQFILWFFFPLHCLLYYFGEINTFYLTVYLSIFLAKWASSTISAFPRLSQRHAMPFSYEHWSSVPCTLCLLNLLIIFIGKSFYSQNSKKYFILYTGELFPTLCYVCVCS